MGLWPLVFAGFCPAPAERDLQLMSLTGRQHQRQFGWNADGLMILGIIGSGRLPADVGCG
ncbi:MAG: hypothetical protein C0494_16005 [Sphingobium sp.]|nr:hypothetical protein [Sphingobium sp.]